MILMIQSKVKKLIDLGVQASKLKRSLSDRVQDVARRYINAAHDTNRGYGFPEKPVHFDHWEVEDKEIVVSWSDSWNYGGYDEGEFCFPAEYLYDENALVKFEEKRKIEKEIKKQKKEEVKQQKDEIEFEKLKKKLNKEKN